MKHSTITFKPGAKVVILHGLYKGQTATVSEAGRVLTVTVHRSGAVVEAGACMVRRAH